MAQPSSASAAVVRGGLECFVVLDLGSGLVQIAVQPGEGVVVVLEGGEIRNLWHFDPNPSDKRRRRRWVRKRRAAPLGRPRAESVPAPRVYVPRGDGGPALAILASTPSSGVRRGGMEFPTLVFSVSQLLGDGQGASRVHQLQPSGALGGGRVELVRIGAGALVRASLEVILEGECSRCLSPLAIPIAVAFDEVYEQRFDVTNGTHLESDDLDPEAFTISRNHLIDITEGVRQYCEAAAPMAAALQR